MLLRLLCLLFVLSCFSACASKPMVLNNEATIHIKSIDHVVSVPQNNLDITVTPTNGGGGGLIGSLIASGIDAVRRADAEKEARPIIEELRSFDFRSVMLNSVMEAIESSNQFNYDVNSWLEIVETDTGKRVLVAQSKSNAVLLTIVKYELTSNNLILSATSSMYPNTTSLEKFKKSPNEDAKITDDDLIYRNEFEFKKQAITAENIKNSLIEGAQNISKQLIADISNPI